MGAAFLLHQPHQTTEQMNSTDITLAALLALGWLGSIAWAHASGFYRGYGEAQDQHDSRSVRGLIDEENGK
jgi:hypothetical protein